MASFSGYEPKNFVLRDTWQAEPFTGYEPKNSVLEETSSSENRFAPITMAGGNPLAEQMSVTARVNAELSLNSNAILVPIENDSLAEDLNNLSMSLDSIHESLLSEVFTNTGSGPPKAKEVSSVGTTRGSDGKILQGQAFSSSEAQALSSSSR